MPKRYRYSVPDCAAAIEIYPLTEQIENGIQQHGTNFKDAPATLYQHKKAAGIAQQKAAR